MLHSYAKHVAAISTSVPVNAHPQMKTHNSIHKNSDFQMQRDYQTPELLPNSLETQS